VGEFTGPSAAKVISGKCGRLPLSRQCGAPSGISDFITFGRQPVSFQFGAAIAKPQLELDDCPETEHGRILERLAREIGRERVRRAASGMNDVLKVGLQRPAAAVRTDKGL
jgi:hypothetical protein